MERALRELDLVYRSPSATAAQRAESRGWASVALSLDDLDAAAAVARTTRSAATDPGAHVAVSLATSMLAWVEMFRAQLRDGLATVDDGVVQADVSPARQGHRYPLHVIRGRILIELDRLEDARATLETGMRISEELGVRWPLSAYQTILGIERFVAGEWDDALAEFEAAVELADETGERYNLVLGYSTTSLIAVHRNDLERASELASAADDELDHGGERYPGHWSARTRALLLEAAGDAPAAYAALGECWDQSVSAGLAVEYPALGPDLVRLALAVGDHARARQVTSAVDAVAARNDVASLDGAALRCRGLCDDDAELLQHSVEVYGRSPRPLQLALTCEEAGAALVRSGDRDRAVPVLHRALDGFEQLEAERDVARVRATLRELGVHRGQRGTRQRPRTGWASLTPTERTVSDLVAEGLTNPQIGERLFVSRRTVQTHLAHVFRKLQMSSRTELAAAVTRRQRRT
jgi:DNA-binding CsgD family transcriptional regulator